MDGIIGRRFSICFGKSGFQWLRTIMEKMGLVLGKAEVVSSILTGSTTDLLPHCHDPSTNGRYRSTNAFESDTLRP